MNLKGQNLRVFVGGKCVALAKSCTIHIGTQTEDSSTKDSEGNWGEIEVVGKNWDIQTESLVTVDSDSTGELPSELLSAILNSTLLTLKFDKTSGTKNRTADSSALELTGTAYLTDFSLSAPNRQNATLSCQFTGSGALS